MGREKGIDETVRESSESLLKKLDEYGKSDFYPFHMPGHKRMEIPDSFAGEFPDPYSIDITEIDGFDNLHHAEGILKESMERAAKIYGAEKSYYLVNGSTCGILSAVCGTTNHGEAILMARNCHKSAYPALILNQLSAYYIYPDFLDSFGINGGIRPEEIREMLEKHEVQAVFLVSPTYEGIVSDIEGIAKIVHSFGIPLIVDEAHGAHFTFADVSGKFPRSALACGADVVIESLHKTLPSFTQTAVMHIQGNLIDQAKIERYLGMFQSSSPSYIFMAGIERCIRYMDRSGRMEMVRYGERLERFFERMKLLRVLRVVDRSICGESSVYDWDMSKIVVSVKRAWRMNGEILGDLLRQRYHLEVEMCAPDYLVAMTSLMDTEEGLCRLAEALFEIDKTLMGQNYDSGKKIDSRLPRAVTEVSLSEAFEGPESRMNLSDSVGRPSKEFVYLYPPGIPILAPGELITEEIVRKIREYREAGLPVQGISDASLSTILTVAKHQEIML